MTPFYARVVLAISLTLCAGAVAQDDTGQGAQRENSGPIIELESQVTGNREQPQVFHVVPWQTPESPVPGYNPLERQLNSVFGHLERDELQRALEQRQEPGDADQ